MRPDKHMALAARIALISIAIIMLSIDTACAEVMDKEPALSFIWTWCIIGAAVCYLAARYKPLALLITLPVALLYNIAVFFELQEAPIRQAIINEAGSGYVTSVYISGSLVILSIIFGLLLKSRQTKALT